MKKVLCILLSAILITASVVTTSAANVSSAVSATSDEADTKPTERYCNGFYYTVFGDKTAGITKYDGNEKNLTIPDLIDGYKITDICWDAFANNYSITNITLPDSLEYISNMAFSGTRIKTITIPKNVKAIQYNAFPYTLSNVFVDKNNESYTDIDGVLFDKDCTQLRFFPKIRIGKYIIPNSVKEIYSDAFEDCSLEEIVFTENVSSDPYTYISFQGSDNLKKVIVDCECIDIGYSSFYFCDNLEEINVTKKNIDFYSVNGILFSKSTNELLAYPQKNKTEVFTIPEGVVKSRDIKNTSLKTLNVTSTVTELGNISCDALENINVSEDNRTYCSVDGVLYSKDMTKLLFFPISSPIIDLKVPNTVIEIDCLFDDSKYLRNVIFSKNVLKIENGPSSVFGESIENFFVEEGNPIYYSVEGVLFKRGEKCDELIAFPQNNKTKVFEIPEGTEVIIGQSYLYKLKYLETVFIPSSIKIYDLKGLYMCPNLKNIYVNDNNTVFSDIDGVLFSKDKKELILYPQGRNDKSYVIPEGTKSVGYVSFYNCDQLLDYTIPKSVTSIQPSMGFHQYDNP